MVKLLFQVKNNDFGEEITLKPYLKYVYEPVSKGPKSNKTEEILEHIDDFSNHQYSENPSKKRGYFVFCVKKSTLGPLKEQDVKTWQFQKTFQLDQEDLIEFSKKNKPKRERFRGKYTQ